MAACLRLRSWRFRSTWLLLSASKAPTPSRTLTCHECRSCAMASQLLSGMLACASDRFSWSLKRRFGLPLGRLPSASSPYSIIFGRRVGGMRAICPTQRRRCWRIVASMLGSDAWVRILLFVILSFQRTRKIWRSLACWNFSSCLTSRE